MKTSFYFVIWILIYPLLGLLNIDFINNNSFIFALAAVWGLSLLIKQLIPDILLYAHALQTAPLLEDVYTCNISSFSNRLSRDTAINIIFTIYLIVTTIIIGFAVFTLGINDWIALIVFLFFTVTSVISSIKLINANNRLKNDPSKEQCQQIVDETYDLDYTSYYDAHTGKTYSEMLPYRPKYFSTFQIVSIIFAAIATILGIVYLVIGTLNIWFSDYIELKAVGIMTFLYGSLATYFGVKDLFSTTKNINKPL